MQTLLRLPAVKARTGLSRSTIYLWISQGKFPAAYPLGGRAVGWLESQISDWIAERTGRAPFNGEGSR
jgi:prophage regulatory protein